MCWCPLCWTCHCARAVTRCRHSVCRRRCSLGRWPNLCACCAAGAGQDRRSGKLVRFGPAFWDVLWVLVVLICGAGTNSCVKVVGRNFAWKIRKMPKAPAKWVWWPAHAVPVPGPIGTRFASAAATRCLSRGLWQYGSGFGLSGLWGCVCLHSANAYRCSRRARCFRMDESTIVGGARRTGHITGPWHCVIICWIRRSAIRWPSSGPSPFCCQRQKTQMPKR